MVFTSEIWRALSQLAGPRKSIWKEPFVQLPKLPRLPNIAEIVWLNAKNALLNSFSIWMSLAIVNRGNCSSLG
jgi:hypothetical protein